VLFSVESLIVGPTLFQRLLPDAGAHLATVKTGDEPVMALPVNAFR
jgi:hypothetical protein